MNDPKLVPEIEAGMERDGFRKAVVMWIREEPDGAISQRALADGPWLRDLEAKVRCRPGAASVKCLVTVAEALVNAAFSAEKMEPDVMAKLRDSLLRAAIVDSQSTGVRDHMIVTYDGDPKRARKG